MSARIVLHLPRQVRRRLERWRHASRDARLRNRIQIVLLYDRGWGAHRIAQALGCVPATAVRVVNRYLDLGDYGLLDARRDNGQPKVDEDMLEALSHLVAGSAEDHGWQRSTWTRELLAATLRDKTGTLVSVTTLARMLKILHARWGMARPTVLCPWSKARRTRRSRKILMTVENLPANEVAFFEDEVDIHLNPRVGRDWMLQGRRSAS